MLSLSKCEGFNEFLKAIAIISGGEVAPDKNEESKQQEKIEDKDDGPEPIVENQPNTLDQIDPLFTEALDAPSLQIIKENE